MRTINFMYLRTVVSISVFLFIAGCTTVTLVQPYDADLYSNTESFYKKTSKMIAKGISVSPKTNSDRKAIKDNNVEEHPGHYNQFKDKYDSLLIDANSLILRALANSGSIDSNAQEMHTKIESAITNSIPNECDDLQNEFSSVSLTVRNYIDMKCLIGKWGQQHNSKDSTGDKLILKKANWEARSKTLFQGILAIQKSEASKKDD